MRLMRFIENWQKVVHDQNVKNGFYDGEGSQDLHRKLLLIISEICEAQEELRAGHKPEEIYFNPGSDKPEGFSIELADASIRIMDILQFVGVNLETAMNLKHDYNLTRPHLHNKKF